MNLVIAVPKTGKAYNKKLENPSFLNKKIGEEISLNEIGLLDYKAIITGGSDKDGFPMKKSIIGTSRRKVLLSKGVGFRAGKKDERKRITIRGNAVGADIHQLNLKITEMGKEDIDKILGKKEEKTGEEKETKAAEKTGTSKKEESTKKEEKAEKKEK